MMPRFAVFTDADLHCQSSQYWLFFRHWCRRTYCSTFHYRSGIRSTNVAHQFSSWESAGEKSRYSGAIADLLKKGEGDIDFDNLKASGRVILASSSATNVSLQKADGLSLYTSYLIEGMEGAAYPGNGQWIAAQNLHEYADRRFEIESQGAYCPKIISEDTGFNLPIVRAPKSDPKLEYRRTIDRICQELDHDRNSDFQGVIEDELDRGSLETLRLRLKISASDAQSIEKQVQKPYLIRDNHRQTYTDYFKKAVEDGCLPDERQRRRLLEIRQNLCLSEEDTISIENYLREQLNLIDSTPPSAITKASNLEDLDGCSVCLGSFAWLISVIFFGWLIFDVF